jgi:hypothetical protein
VCWDLAPVSLAKFSEALTIHFDQIN